MKKAFIAAGFVLCATAAWTCNLDTAMAVNVAYGANDTVQRAIDIDFCADDMGLRDHDAYHDLSLIDQVAYDVIEDALRDAYRESLGTDNALETIDRDFCYAIGER